MIKENQKKCNKCGNIILENIQNCPRCESNSFLHEIHRNDELNIYSQIKIILKNKLFKRPLVEEVIGDSFHQKTGKWNFHYRKIDRKNNKYVEIVYNKNLNKIIHKCIEPLKKHIGHGSNKKKLSHFRRIKKNNSSNN